MTDYEKYVQLSWEILEHKWRYYIGVNYGVNPVNDSVYDATEAEYIYLAGKLGQPEYTNRIVGFPSDSPSGRLVDSKMRKLYKIKSE